MAESNTRSDEGLIEAVRKGCQAADVHLTCSFPKCTCKQIPAAIHAVLSERGTTFTAIGYYDAPSKMTLWEPGKEPPHGALVYRPSERNER